MSPLGAFQETWPHGATSLRDGLRGLVHDGCPLDNSVGVSSRCRLFRCQGCLTFAIVRERAREREREREREPHCNTQGGHNISPTDSVEHAREGDLPLGGYVRRKEGRERAGVLGPSCPQERERERERERALRGGSPSGGPSLQRERERGRGFFSCFSSLRGKGKGDNFTGWFLGGSLMLASDFGRALCAGGAPVMLLPEASAECHT